MIGFEHSSAMAVSGNSVEAPECVSGVNQTEPPSEIPPLKRKRNLPGTPDPEAEVIALSPNSLLATNRFICDICNKGFQRDQNLQLHRRGHNLPWKLKQRTGNEIRKRVYVCPEKSCVHHDPQRALGDLTGIKKHFSRKHGEKKWTCQRCTKKYAVQSDWKAHMKICGSKEYRCDCGTLFSRRDSFITHRAFCEALAHESARTQPQNQTLAAINNSDHQQSFHTMETVLPPSSTSPLTPSTDVLSPVNSIQTAELPENATAVKWSGTKPATGFPSASTPTTDSATTTTVSGGSTSNNGTVFASIFASPATVIEQPISLSLSSSLYLSNNPTLFPPSDQDLQHKHLRQYLPASQPALSATALLQKAAQMGAKSSNTSFLHALGLALPSTSSGGNHYQDSNNGGGHWSNAQMKQERDDNRYLSGTAPTTSLTDLMMGPPAPTTLDFLGVDSRGSSGGLSAYLTSIRSGLHAAGGASAAVPSYGGVNSGGNNGWDDRDPDDRKPTLF